MTKKARGWRDRPTWPAIGLVLGCAFLAAGCAPAAEGPPAPAPDEAAPAPPGYRLYVTNESADVVTRVGFTPGPGFAIEHDIPVGAHPTELSAPHGVAVAPDAAWFFVTLGHGRPGSPFGSLLKFEVGPDTAVARVELGRFPASLDVAPDGEHIFVVNFNLHGDHVPSDMSVVHAGTMEEVARTTLCVMPHGVRTANDGTRVYTVCMHSEQLVVVDGRSFEVSERFSLRPGHEGPLEPRDTGVAAPDAHPPSEAAACRPTWAAPGEGERSRLVYVACNANAEVLEVDIGGGTVTRRFATGEQPYNTAVSPDGSLLGVTLRGDQGVMFFDLDTGEERARLTTTRPITHGIVFSADGRFAFVTNESVGSRPGTLEAIELTTFERAASIELYLQPTGLDLLDG